MARFRKDRLRTAKHPTLREKIVDTIRDAIIKGSLISGERIAETSLAQMLGSSRTPIREAFRQLETEGFIRVVPRKGAMVSQITDESIREFYEIKGVIEGYAARRAVNNLKDNDYKKMETLNKELQRLEQTGNRKALHRVHNEFHDVFLKACGNRSLYELAKQIELKCQRGRIALSLLGKIDFSIKKHAEIIDAFRNQDSLLVEQLVKENATEGFEQLFVALQKSA